MSEEQVVENTEQPSEAPAEEKPGVEHEALKALPVEELINIIAETRGEAKKYRLQKKELKEQVSSYEQAKTEAEQEQLKKNNEWQKLFEQKQEETADYEELKEFKTNYLEKCKNDVEERKSQLTKADEEVFALSAKNMTYDEQLDLINKLLKNRQSNVVIDTTQSTTRTNKTEEKPKNPLRSPGGNDPILAGLRSAREQK